MARKVWSKDELLRQLKEHEKEKREEWRKCKNCKNSFYRKIEPSDNFPEPSEYCGCKLKFIMVDPNGCCEEFS